MTSTPDLFLFRTVLHDTIQVRARSRKSFQLTTVGAHEDSGLVAKFENFT
jgi:hypothetical protein